MFSTIETAVKELKKGNFIIVVDDENRENEGDLVISAEKITEKQMAFLIRYTSGIICLATIGKRLEQLNIPLMVDNNTAKHGTPFTVSVDGKNTGTGISAKDRTKTVKLFVNKKTKPNDLTKPGHVFPLRANNAGVLRRAGHTEASVDLMKLAKLFPAAVIGEVMNDNGTVAKMPQLVEFAKKHKIKIITIADLIKYRREKETLIKKAAVVKIPTMFGEFMLYSYIDKITNEVHLALVKGNVNTKKDVLVRVHSQCLTGDVFHSLRCDCGKQLHKTMKMINEKGQGVILYMRQEGRGIGLLNKMHAYRLQEKGFDTVDANLKLGFKADLRDYGIGAQILKDLGLTTIKLITNNPKKIHGLQGYGLKITGRIPLEIKPSKYNKKYLKTKKKRLGHWLVL